jgi:hypothetical protein
VRPANRDADRVPLTFGEAPPHPSAVGRRSQQLIGPADQAVHVDVVRRVLRVPGDPGPGAQQQGPCPGRVPAQYVGEAHGKLSKALPQVTLLGCGRLPGTLQDLVGMEGHPLIQQPLCLDQRWRWRKDQVIGNARHPLHAMWQRTPEPVACARVPGASPGIPVSAVLRHRPVLPPLHQTMSRSQTVAPTRIQRSPRARTTRVTIRAVIKPP